MTPQNHRELVLLQVLVPKENEDGKQQRPKWTAFLRSEKATEYFPPGTSEIGENTWLIPKDNKLHALGLLIWAAHSIHLQWSIRYVLEELRPDTSDSGETTSETQT